FERRGAAEVVALDWEPFMDTPLAEPSAGVEGDPGAFAIAREILGASVKRIHGRPGDRDVDSLGSFDLIIATDLVGRVRNPQLMLEHLARLCSGTLFLVERIDPLLERYGVLCLAEFTGSHRFKGRWWLPNTNMLKTMALVAGLDPVDEVGRFEMWTAGEGITHHVVLRGHANSRPALKTFMLALGGEGRVVESAPAQATAERAVRLGSVELKVELPRGLADRVGPARRLWKRPAKQDTPPHPNPTGSSVNEHPDAGPTTARAQELRRRMEGIDWYHTIELGDGVITPGFVDHRAQVSSYRLPASLSGQRCLDVATFDGFWAFEMERRGAAEVVAIDVANGIDCDIPTFLLDEVSSWGDSPMGRGFRVAHEILGSRVRHEICNVYDLTPERFGQFDLIFLSDLLLHLRDPQLALERIASVCRGTAIVGDVYNAMLECVPNRNLTQYVLWLPGGYTWWQPSSSTLRQMMKVAGFHEVIEVGRLTLQTQGGPCAKVIYHGSVRGE
ncbi:MAG TPA: methyltransferase domain-containing protein, partial [Candidatus Dormibacteraeota bacterium]|nr:methyltransferase domain-containing protein [Candidatus Dormibacteraeota bacterium]